MEVIDLSSTKKLNVYTWIIQELAVNNTDQVSVVCKDSLTLSVSWLLLASVSPCIQDASFSLANSETEDLTIIAPDLDVYELQKLIQLISQDECLSEDLISESQVEFLRIFDGILWPDFYSNPVFSPEGFDSYICNPKDPIISPVKMELEDDLFKSNFYEIEEEKENYVIAQPLIKNNLKDYSQEYKDKAIHLVKTGSSQKEVAEMLGIGKRTLERWWADYKREGHMLQLNTNDNIKSLESNIENVKLQVDVKNKKRSLKSQAKTVDEEWVIPAKRRRKVTAKIVDEKVKKANLEWVTPVKIQKKTAAKITHLQVKPKDITEDVNAPENKDAEKNIIIACDKCSFVTSNQTTLDKHVNKHSLRQTCDICGFVSTSTDSSAMKKHKAFNHDTELHDCPECEGKFNLLQLKTHIKNHKESICNECGLKVKNLRSHVHNMHTPFHLQKYKCNSCQKGFNDRSKLKMHMYSVHTKERPYKCRYGCDLAYNDMSNRNCHEKKKHGKLFITKISQLVT